MSGKWIWAVALALYGIFALWYNNHGGPLSPEEVEHFMGLFEARAVPPEGLANVRAFLEEDDGGQFFMVNLIRLKPDPVAMPNSGELLPAQRVLEGYTGKFMPALFARAGHPAFIGQSAARYLEHWSVEEDPGWTFAGVIRYRSRRDMVELTTDPFFDPSHVYKIAAIANTLAFPIAPAAMFFGPRVWVAMMLALVGALGHLILLLRAGSKQTG